MEKEDEEPSQLDEENAGKIMMTTDEVKLGNQTRMCLLTKATKFARLGVKGVVNFFEDEGQVLSIDVFFPHCEQECCISINYSELNDLVGLKMERFDTGGKQEACLSLIDCLIVEEDDDGDMEIILSFESEDQHKQPTIPTEWLGNQINNILQTAINRQLAKAECSTLISSMVDFVANGVPYGPGQYFLLQEKVQHQAHQLQSESLKWDERHRRLKRHLAREKEARQRGEEEAELSKLKFQALLQQLHSSETKVLDLQSELEEAQYEKSQLEDELVEEKDRVGLLTRDTESLQAEKSRLSKVLEQCEGELLQANEVNSKITLDFNEMERRASTLQNDLDSLITDHNLLQERFDQLSLQAQGLQEDLQHEVEENTSLEQQNAGLLSEKTTLTEEVAKLSSILQQHDEKAKIKEKELESLRKQRKKYHMENRKLEDQLTKAEAQADQVVFLREREAQMVADCARLEKENEAISRQLGNALSRELEIRSHIFRGEGIPKHLLAESRLKVVKGRKKKSLQRKHHRQNHTSSLPEIFKA
mmetsp:Transcript_6247/g.8158  ORF Transcript_6247/g.8158 Transcript_6247/m.8158 type:complete len:534 (+) Transcript_6247:62-1663(+)